MQDVKLQRLLLLYRETLIEYSHAKPNRLVPGVVSPLPLGGLQLDHAAWMVETMLSNLDGWALDMESGVRWPDDKLQRWLGFVQGVLWMAGLYTIDELQAQTREATLDPIVVADMTTPEP